ncbi:hypothetical protein Droror1_Dr00020189 [Drosera rotundifolia]
MNASTNAFLLLRLSKSRSQFDNFPSSFIGLDALVKNSCFGSRVLCRGVRGWSCSCENIREFAGFEVCDAIKGGRAWISWGLSWGEARRVVTIGASSPSKVGSHWSCPALTRGTSRVEISICFAADLRSLGSVCAWFDSRKLLKRSRSDDEVWTDCLMVGVLACKPLGGSAGKWLLKDEDKISVSTRVLAEVIKWMERFECIVIGPGLGRDPFLMGCVSEIMRHARIGGITVLRKGKSDYISDGETVCSVSIFGSSRRCGGQGDILSGSIAVFLSWARKAASIEGSPGSRLAAALPMNPTIVGCVAGCALLRKAASVAFEEKKRSTLTSDIIECLGTSLEEISPAL